MGPAQAYASRRTYVVHTHGLKDVAGLIARRGTGRAIGDGRIALEPDDEGLRIEHGESDIEGR